MQGSCEVAVCLPTERRVVAALLPVCKAGQQLVCCPNELTKPTHLLAGGAAKAARLALLLLLALLGVARRCASACGRSVMRV